MIEKNILESNLGATPQTDGNNYLSKVSRTNMQKEEKILVKIISETSEKFKVSIRNIRRKYMDLVKE